MCSHRCNNISWEANLPMQFVLLVGERGLPSIKSFSGKCYLTNHICNCSTYLYTSRYLQAFQKKRRIVVTVQSSRHCGTRSLALLNSTSDNLSNDSVLSTFTHCTYALCYLSEISRLGISHRHSLAPF